MSYNIIPISVDEAKLFLFFDEVQKELKYKNRFKNDKLDEFIEYIICDGVNKACIKKGATLYRARIYTDLDAQEKFNSNKDMVFQGYDQEGSFVNKEFDHVSEGRCNPKWIPYLYASKSEKCCIHEVRPRIKDFVSVAKIKVKTALKIIDFSCLASWYEKEGFREIIPGVKNDILCIYLGELFSVPHRNENDYLITQYISEKIKNAGYDGIAYKSSLYDGFNDINYVIFNYDSCEVTSSWLCRIKALDVKYDKSH
jgi:hypothetical protein